VSLLARLSNVFKGFLSLFVKDWKSATPRPCSSWSRRTCASRSQLQPGPGHARGPGRAADGPGAPARGEEKELRAKTTAHLRAGNTSAAGQHALRLQTVTRELAENRTQMQSAEETYKNLVKARDVAVSAAKAKIESLKGAINDMRMKTAMAEMNEMAAGMIGQIGGSGDTLNRLHEMVEEERNKAAGRARVAKDSLDMGEIQVKEAEQLALADQALADFAAAEGLSLPGVAPAAPATDRTMGDARPQADGEKQA
jgi:hypothetical protein